MFSMDCFCRKGDNFEDVPTNVIALRFKLTTMSSNGLLVWYELKEGWDIKSFLAIVLVDGKVLSIMITLELLPIRYN